MVSHSDGGAVLADAAAHNGGGERARRERRRGQRRQRQRVPHLHASAHLRPPPNNLLPIPVLLADKFHFNPHRTAKFLKSNIFLFLPKVSRYLRTLPGFKSNLTAFLYL